MVEVFTNAVIVLEADPQQRVNFQTFPEMIVDVKAANWADIPTIGRSEPIKTYAHSGPRQIVIPLVFAASVDAGDDGTPEDVKRNVDFCQSLVYPQATQSGLILYPPVCVLIVGDMIESRGVVRQVGSRYTGPWSLQGDLSVVEQGNNSQPTVSEDGRLFVNLPLISMVEIVWEEVNIVPHDHEYVRRGRTIQ